MKTNILKNKIVFEPITLTNDWMKVLSL